MVISAGSWLTILGSNLDRGSAQAANANSPLDWLAEQKAKLNRTAVPLSYTSPTQITACLPLDPSPPPGIPDYHQGELEVTVSEAGGDGRDARGID